MIGLSGERAEIGVVVLPELEEAGGQPLLARRDREEALAVLEEIGAPTGSLQIAQGQASSWWHPGRSARRSPAPGCAEGSTCW